MTTKTDLAEAVVVERTLNVPVEQVWKALTDVDQMREWYFDLKEFKPKPGFEFEFVVEHEGNKYHHLCRITKTPAYARKNFEAGWTAIIGTELKQFVERKA